MLSKLKALADEKNRAFSVKLIPHASLAILGVRLPLLRTLAKSVAQKGWYDASPPQYMEEVMLRGMVLGYLKSTPIKERLELLAQIVPSLDNWSLVDSCCSTYKFAQKHRCEVWHWLQPYLHSHKEFEARFAVVMLLMHFCKDAQWAQNCANILPHVPQEAYYAAMAVAWCCCELHTHYPSIALALLQVGVLPDKTRGMTLRKIRESRRCDLPLGLI